jgi:hypothetical protein
LRKITWLNSQQPKTRGHVEHPSCWQLILNMPLNNPINRLYWLEIKASVIIILGNLKILTELWLMSNITFISFWRNRSIINLCFISWNLYFKTNGNTLFSFLLRIQNENWWKLYNRLLPISANMPTIINNGVICMTML